MTTYVDRTAAAVEHCEAMALEHPELADQYYNKFATYLREKLWHQLTTTILDFLSDNKNGTQFAELYDKVVLAVDAKLHPLSSARMAVLTANYLSSQSNNNDTDAAKAIIENCQEKLAAKTAAANDNNDNNNENNNNMEEAKMYLQSKHSMLTLQQLLKIPGFAVDKMDEETKASLNYILEKVIQTNGPIIQELSSSSSSTEKLDNDTALVHAAHYGCTMNYYKLVGPPEAFYEQAMNYLNYYNTQDKQQDDNNNQQQQLLAVDLCLAALTGDGIYNLTAVVQTPIVLTLMESPDQNKWLLELLQATAAGDIPKFQQLSQLYAKQIANQPALVHRSSAIQEKLTLTALVLHILHKDSHERGNLDFAELQTVLHLDNMDQVEWVLMRAFSVKLLEGKMDQCSQQVEITYVQPRSLSKSQMKSLAGKYGEWAVKVHKIKTEMTEQASATLLA